MNGFAEVQCHLYDSTFAIKFYVTVPAGMLELSAPKFSSSSILVSLTSYSFVFFFFHSFPSLPCILDVINTPTANPRLVERYNPCNEHVMPENDWLQVSLIVSSCTPIFTLVVILPNGFSEVSSH